MELLNSICWSNSFPVLVFVCETKNREINLDELEIQLSQDRIDLLERIDFLIHKGLPLEYNKETNMVKLKSI